jgi:hypothetical protein
MELIRFNGIGTYLLGVSHPNDAGVQTGTIWFTLLFMPIIPMSRLSRYRFKAGPKRGLDRQQYTFLAQGPLNIREVIKTYLMGWLVYPAFLFVPIFLMMLLGSLIRFDGTIVLIFMLVWPLIFMLIVVPRVAKLFAGPAPD